MPWVWCDLFARSEDINSLGADTTVPNSGVDTIPGDGANFNDGLPCTDSAEVRRY